MVTTIVIRAPVAPTTSRGLTTSAWTGGGPGRHCLSNQTRGPLPTLGADHQRSPPRGRSPRCPDSRPASASQCPRPGLSLEGGPMNEALVGALVGAAVAGVLAPLGSYLVALTMDRRAKQAGVTAVRLDTAREVLASLQNLNRKLVNIARHEDAQALADNAPLWVEQLEAATRWNSARYAAALVCPDEQLSLLDDLDREVDRVFDAALSKHWTGRQFRALREELGRLGARFLSSVRAEVLSQPSQEVETIVGMGAPATAGRDMTVLRGGRFAAV